MANRRIKKKQEKNRNTVAVEKKSFSGTMSEHNREMLGEYSLGGVFEPYDSEEERQEHFEVVLESEIEHGVRELIKEQEEELFFKFVQRQTSDFDILLEDYDPLFAGVNGRRGRIPKVPNNAQAHRLQERMIQMIEKLNSKRGMLDEETFLIPYSSEKVSVNGAKAKTVQRIIDARLEKLKLRAATAPNDLDHNSNTDR